MDAASSDDADFTRGMALLANPSTADEWECAITLIQEAAAAGHAQAAERCALFECMGVRGSADWRKGLGWLVTAAQRGSQAAQRQLILLAEDRFVTAAAAADARQAAEWSGLRAGIRLEEKLRAPSRRTLSPRPLVLGFEGFATPAECQWLIEAAERRLEPAFVHDSRTGAREAHPNRTNSGATFPIADMDVIVEMVRTRISAAIGVPLANLEVTQVLHYSVGEEFRPHFDFLDPSAEGFQAEVARNGQRAATALVYLNDGFDGGETSFPQIGLDYRGGPGDALVFTNVDPEGNPDPATLHCGMPPTSGEKWILSQWIRERPLMGGS